MIKFNNKELPSWVNVTGFSFQTLNLSILEYEAKRRTGNIDAGVDKGGISLDLSLFIEPVKGLTLFDQADQMKAFMMGDNWKTGKLVLLEQPDKFYNARVSNAGEVMDGFTHGEMTLSFYCADPKKYTLNQTSVSSALGEAVINYSGMEKATVEVLISVDKAVKNIQLKHVESGNQIEILGDFTVGQTVLIDSDSRNVKVNNDNAKDKMAFSSKWPYLSSGKNTFICTNPDAVKNEFQLKYREVN